MRTSQAHISPDIVASNLPTQEKTSRLVKTSRDLRVQVKIADMDYPLGWKSFAEQISWLKPSDMVSQCVCLTIDCLVSMLSGDCSTAHKESTVRIEVYAKFSHGDHQSILLSELLTVEALLERAQQSQQIGAFSTFV